MNLKKLKRPLPPPGLDYPSYGDGSFVPAPNLEKWIRANFIEEGGPLYREAHNHLKHATIGCLWTDKPLTKNQKTVAAMARMPSAQGDKWIQGSAAQQLRDWFGIEPVFLLTFYGPYCAEVEDITFCALVRHELLHCAQAVDRDGLPKTTKDGEPKFAIRGHDVEEFTIVVEDFGIDAAAGDSRAFVEAARHAPKIGRARIVDACGTCQR